MANNPDLNPISPEQINNLAAMHGQVAKFAKAAIEDVHNFTENARKAIENSQAASTAELTKLATTVDTTVKNQQQALNAILVKLESVPIPPYIVPKHAKTNTTKPPTPGDNELSNRLIERFLLLTFIQSMLLMVLLTVTVFGMLVTYHYSNNSNVVAPKTTSINLPLPMVEDTGSCDKSVLEDWNKFKIQCKAKIATFSSIILTDPTLSNLTDTLKNSLNDYANEDKEPPLSYSDGTWLKVFNLMSEYIITSRCKAIDCGTAQITVDGDFKDITGLMLVDILQDLNYKQPMEIKKLNTYYLQATKNPLAIKTEDTEYLLKLVVAYWVLHQDTLNTK